MITYTQRLDDAMRKAAWAHEQAGQHRKGSDIPYIIHPFGVMLIASNVTDDEDILIACLLHDIVEDVESSIYGRAEIQADFGNNVLALVMDVTKDENEQDWHLQSKAYLNHLEYKASDGAIIVSAADKIHNLLSIISDYQRVGDDLWGRFTTKNSKDQLWLYESILAVIQKRNAPTVLCETLAEQVDTLKQLIR